MSEVARECAVSSKVAASYFDILDDLLIGVRIPPFTKRSRRRLVQRPKFFFFDAGVYRTIRPKGPVDSPEEIDGPVFETLLLQHLRALIDGYDLRFDLYHWRRVGGIEVDFVLYGEAGLIAIEVKRKRRPSGNDLRGLRAFTDEYPMAKCYVLANIPQPQPLNGIAVVPLSQVFHQLPQMLGAH